MYERHADEEYIDYFVRLFEYQQEYGLTCAQIAELLNKQNGNDYGECAYRKEYRAFNRGRQYELSKLEAGVSTKILALSDFHVPYQLPIDTFSDYVGIADVLVLNGDIEDCQSCSAFPKKYRVNFVDEMVQTRKYLIDLITYLSPKKVIITRGNHEDRLLKYMTDRLNDDLLGLMPDSPIDLIVKDGFKNKDRQAQTEVWYTPLQEVFSDILIEYTGEWHCKVGKTIFAHPLTYSGAMLKTTEKAVNYFLRNDRDFDAMVLAHTHKLGSYTQGGINMYEQGCCCRIEELNYTDGKLTYPQQKGFIFVCQDKYGSILPDKTKLIQL